MKAIVVLLLGLIVVVPTTSYAEFVPVCVQCTGTPQEPMCCGGKWSGGIICWVNGSSCWIQGKCSYAGGGCFVSGTLAETPYGAVVIEDLVVGDRVLGLSDDGEPVVNEVVEVHRALAVQYYIINDEISVTDAHPFLVDDEWVEAQDIRVGDILVSPDGTAVPVGSVVSVDYGVRVYNISVSGNHTFFAEGILAHNKPPYDPQG